MTNISLPCSTSYSFLKIPLVLSFSREHPNLTITSCPLPFSWIATKLFSQICFWNTKETWLASPNILRKIRKSDQQYVCEGYFAIWQLEASHNCPYHCHSFSHTVLLWIDQSLNFTKCMQTYFLYLDSVINTWLTEERGLWFLKCIWTVTFND